MWRLPADQPTTPPRHAWAAPMSIPPDTECGTECGSDVGADGRADWRTNLSSGYGPSRGRGQLSWEQLEDEAAEDGRHTQKVSLWSFQGVMNKKFSRRFKY